MVRDEAMKYLYPATEKLFPGMPVIAAIIRIDRLFDGSVWEVYKKKPHCDDLPLTYEEKTILIQLNGSYGWAIYCAMCAKKGIEP